MIANRLFVILFFIFTASTVAQSRVTTSIDTTRNKIGAQFNLILKTEVDTMSTVTFPSGPTLGPFEVIRDYPVDTTLKGLKYELVKKYGITQFDSGRYTLPRLTVLINNKPVLTDSMALEVSAVKVDTLKQKLYDIKDVVQAGKTGSKWWIYVLAALILAAATYFAYKYFLARRKDRKEPEVYKTPIEKATGLLQQLEKKELWQKGEVKSYYSELTDIARNYIEEAIHIPAMESTTSELIVALRSAAVKKNMKLSQDTVENLEKVLKQADLVKFAKSKPEEHIIAEDRQKIEKAIITLDQSIPEEIPDDTEFLEQQRLVALKAKKRERIILATGITAAIAVVVLGFFVVTKGFYTVADTIFGHDTKKLLEGHWVASEYGNPSVTLETPEVLKRLDATNFLPKGSMDYLREFQMFGMGNQNDEFSVLVSTYTYKAETEIDLDKSMENVIQVMELQGAHNIVVKQEKYETREGITGLKAFGTFTRLDESKRESARMYYELLLFGQQNGLQQITIMHKEGDRYAGQVTERILTSVELKKVTQ